MCIRDRSGSESKKGFSCQYCGKDFETQKGATYHENFYCKVKGSSKINSTEGQGYGRSGTSGGYQSCGQSNNDSGFLCGHWGKKFKSGPLQLQSNKRKPDWGHDEPQALVSKMTVPHMRHELQMRGKISTGSRDELEARLVAEW
eukprot:TRINITY_DN9088_c0_g1_i2.p1 TRINITY_DN9088_c0_g1~~TRINITY_DN9088_c0_g1_i2.p1  ORF type:complete len:144 (-),score=21.91 TRINITY_DN9088_c0_g1_i2:473-904(-)